MAVENIGILIPTKIPAYVDDADIKSALRAYHYGSYDFDPNETDPAELLTPSIAKTIYDIQTDITALEAKKFASAQNNVPVAGDFPPNALQDDFIWVDKNAATPTVPNSATAVYTNSAPSTYLANGLIWVDKDTSPKEMYAYNSTTSTFDLINIGPSGIIAVNAPITNSGTNTSANLSLGYGYGLTTSSSNLVVDNTVLMPISTVQSWSGQSSTALDIMPRWTVNSSSTISNGTVYFYYFTPLFNFTATNISMSSAEIASAGATLARMGVYSVNPSTQTLSLVARTESDTTLFQSTNTVYTKAFNTTGGYPSTYSFVAGTRYAASVILVGQTTDAKLASSGSAGYSQIAGLSPKMVASVSSESDLGTTITNANATASNNAPVWVRFT